MVKNRSKQIKKAPRTQQGVDTAQRMRSKLATLKSIKQASGPSKKEQADIARHEDDGEDMYSQDGGDNLRALPKDSAVTQDLVNDDFFQHAAGNQQKTADEKRLEMTKKLIEEVKQEQALEDKDDFFRKLQANTTSEVNIINEDDDLLHKKLKYKILEQKEKLFYNIADEYGHPDVEYDRVFMKGHKKAITAMEWLPDNKRVMTASKDCSLIMWDLESQKKLIFKGEKFNRDIAGHFDEVTALAISPNGKYMISGGKDRVVRIWDIHNQK